LTAPGRGLSPASYSLTPIRRAIFAIVHADRCKWMEGAFRGDGRKFNATYKIRDDCSIY
jgi:hypothetical protein